MSTSTQPHLEMDRTVARWLELPMTLFSFLWLVLVGGMIQRVAGPTYRGEALGLSAQEIAVFFAVFFGLWMAFVVEFVRTILRREPGTRIWRHYRRELVACLFPAVRMILRCHVMNGRIWFPILGWREPDRKLRHQLERFFNVPMIIVALMILPVLVVEHFWSDRIQERGYDWAFVLLDTCTVIIWVAFATEFIVMCGVAENKLAYTKAHWLDLAIILLPLISFARALRLARLSRLARLGRVSRTYRLRGLAIRAFKALLLVDIVARVMGRTTEKELRRQRTLLAAKEAEVEELRFRISELESKLAQEWATANSVSIADAAQSQALPPAQEVRPVAGAPMGLVSSQDNSE